MPEACANQGPDNFLQPAGRQRRGIKRDEGGQFFFQLSVLFVKVHDGCERALTVFTEQQEPGAQPGCGAVLTGICGTVLTGQDLLDRLAAVPLIGDDSVRKLMMDPTAMPAPEPADDQYGLAAVCFPQPALPASGDVEQAVTHGTVGSLTAPHIKVLSVPALSSRR